MGKINEYDKIVFEKKKRENVEIKEIYTWLEFTAW